MEVKYNIFLPENVLKGYKKAYQKVEIDWISPDEFLRETASYKHVSPYEEKRKQKLKEKMTSGTPLDPLQIVYDKEGKLWGCQGRHRALAAKDLSIHKIPVMRLKMRW